MDDMTLSVACGSPVANATQEELQAAYTYAFNLPPAAIATDGTGLSSRPNARYKLWLDFKGSTITGTSERQRQHALHHGCRFCIASVAALQFLVCTQTAAAASEAEKPAVLLVYASLGMSPASLWTAQNGRPAELLQNLPCCNAGWNELYCDNSATSQSTTYMYCTNPAPQGVGSSIVIPP